MDITKKTIIYIACPANVVTGGPETLHQLGFQLNNRHFDVKMYYYGKEKHQIKIPDKFKKYGLEYVSEIEDVSSNIVIIPETSTYLLYEFENIQKVIWWLSVDFYTLGFLKNRVTNFIKKHKISPIIALILHPLLYLAYRIKYGKDNALNFEKDKNINEYFHLYNCHYGLEFLLQNGVLVENTYYLCGPISNEYFNNNLSEMQKKDIVLYNPKKGLEYTIKVREYIKKVAPAIEIIPIINMDSSQIIDLLKESKVYMDFGFFPGPERIPREAVLNYCNIITSTKGSAKNNIDFPIPTKYKINIDEELVENVGNKVIQMINYYNEQVSDFDKYRKKVADQVETFEINIDKIFSINEGI